MSRDRATPRDVSRRATAVAPRAASRALAAAEKLRRDAEHLRAREPANSAARVEAEDRFSVDSRRARDAPRSGARAYPRVPRRPACRARDRRSTAIQVTTRSSSTPRSARSTSRRAAFLAMDLRAPGATPISVGCCPRTARPAAIRATRCCASIVVYRASCAPRWRAPPSRRRSPPRPAERKSGGLSRCAAAMLRVTRAPPLVLSHGVSGSGKTHLAG